jgi:hypothetical protein
VRPYTRAFKTASAKTASAKTASAQAANARECSMAARVAIIICKLCPGPSQYALAPRNRDGTCFAGGLNSAGVKQSGTARFPLFARETQSVSQPPSCGIADQQKCRTQRDCTIKEHAENWFCMAIGDRAQRRYFRVSANSSCQAVAAIDRQSRGLYERRRQVRSIIGRARDQRDNTAQAAHRSGNAKSR